MDDDAARPDGTAPPGEPRPVPPPAPARPRRRALHPQDLNALDFILDVFLPEARARGLEVPTAPQVRPLLDELAAEARGYAPVPLPGAAGRPTGASAGELLFQPPGGPGRYPPVGPPGPPPGGPRPPASLPRPPARAPQPAPFPTPPGATAPWGPSGAGPTPSGTRPITLPWAPAPRRTPVQDWWERLRRAVGSDIGVHGLAYLGVLLLFVGVFGLVAFAFGEVTPNLRPVAELSAALVPFLGARMLLRHGATVVGRALEVVGGLLLPIMLITSQVDGYGFPPNPRGTALVIGLTAVCLASAAAFAAWTQGHPESGLRYAVAPAVWLGAAMATIGLGRALPSGQDVAVPSSAQTAAMAAALAATLLAARPRPGHRLAVATRTAAVPGIVVIALLAVLTWGADDVPAVPVAVAGGGLLVALELLRTRVPAALADAAAPVWVGGVALLLGAGSGVDPGVVTAAAAVTFIALVELAGRRAAPLWAVALPGAGLVVALLASWPATGLTVGTLAAVAVWAVVRRSAPLPGTAAGFDGLAAASPAAFALAVAGWTHGSVGVAVAGAITVLATVPARTSVLRRHPADRFWATWWAVAVPLVAVVAVLAWTQLPAPEQWTAVGVLAALGLAALAGPVSAAARPWAVAALLSAAWLAGAASADLPMVVRGGALALGALGMVVAAGRGGVSLGLAGHVLALAALGASGLDWGLVLAVALATAGWVVTAWRGERGGSALATAVAGAGFALVPWGAVALGAPVAAGLALDRGGVLLGTDPWRVLVPVATALGYAAVARWVSARRPRLVAAAASVTAAVVGLAMSADPWPTVAALAAVPAVVVLLPAALRVVPLRWAAWFTAAPVLGLVAHELWPAFRALADATELAATLTAAGGCLVVVGTALARDRFRAEPGPARGVGVVQLACALPLAVLAAPPPDGARLVLVIAALVLVIAAQVGLGALAGVALPLAWGAVLALAWPRLAEAPWVSLVVTAGLLGAAEGLHHLVPARGRWSRWDVPVLVAAAPVAGTALAAAADGDALPPTFVLVGVLLAAVGVRLRTDPVVRELCGAVGSGLVLVGAGDAGAGWLSLALLTLAAAHTVLATRASPAVRTARQVVGAAAAVAAWGSALRWLDVASQVAVDVSAGLAAGVLLALAIAARVRCRDRSWHLVWGTAAFAVLGVALGAALLGPTAAPSFALCAAVAVVAPAAYLARAPLRLAGLRDVAAGAALGTVLLGLAAADAGPTISVLVLCLVGLLGAAGAVPLGLAGHPDARPVVEVGAGAVLVAIAIAVGALPDIALGVPVLAVCAVQAAAAGVVRRELGPQVAAPVLACAAWLLATAGPGRTPQWYTISVGLTMLVVVAIWRRDLRGRGVPPGPPGVALLEMAGVGFLVVASLLGAVRTSPLHAAVAVGLGLAVAAWGVVTRVRRRLAAGVVVVVVAIVLLVAVPLVRLLPSWRGAGGWLMLAGAGLVAVAAASMMERSRAAVRAAVGRFGQLTAEWE